MTPDDLAQRNRVKRAASSLHVPRDTARALLALPGPIRVELLAEVVRVGAGRTLAFTRTQPSIPSA